MAMIFQGLGNVSKLDASASAHVGDGSYCYCRDTGMDEVSIRQRFEEVMLLFEAVRLFAVPL